MSEEQLSLSDYLYSLERFERDLYRYQIETGDLFGRKDKTFLQRRNECFKQIVANYGNIDALRAENERLKEALQKIKNWCCVDPDGGVETTISEMVEQALKEVKE